MSSRASTMRSLCGRRGGCAMMSASFFSYASEMAGIMSVPAVVVAVKWSF